MNRLLIRPVTRKNSMKLYDLKRDSGTKIYCDLSDGSTYIIFHHIDGMYSYCKSENGEVVHLYAGTDLVPVEGEENAFNILKKDDEITV